MSNESAESFDIQKQGEILKSLQKNVNWEIVDERRKFIRQVFPYFHQWYDQDTLPNFQDVLRSEDVERLAMDYINFFEDKEYIKELEFFIFFLAYSGYKDEPKLEGDGKPSSHRTTPVHIAVKKKKRDIVYQLFQIYNRYDVNYTDESGLSHFHVACQFTYFDDAIEKFLESGHDPNGIDRETGNSPLHLALLVRKHKDMIELLLRNGANINLANKEGLTPLHIISKEYYYDVYRNPPIPEVPKILFEISDELNQPLQVDARDKFGNTPLHVAVLYDNSCVIEMLLRRGADPNSANDEGSTPLHEIYKRDIYYDRKGSFQLFFKICDEVNQSVQVDARDKLGRTPLQLAVVNFWPDCIDILFEHGADLSNFIFPTESYFSQRCNKSNNKFNANYRLRLASSALAVVEKIEKRGYELKRSDALTIMKCFAKFDLFEKSSDHEKCWYDDEEFITRAKKIQIRPGLSFDEVVRLRTEEAAKLLSYEDYWKFNWPFELNWQSDKDRELITDNLVEKVSRGFFRSWALDPFMELIHGRLPILCCEMIIEHLSNQDLYNICLAAAGKSS